MRLVDPMITDSLVATASEHTHREHILLEAVALAHRHYGLPTFERIVSIGDGPWDAQAATSIGCEFIGIGPTADHFRGLCPDDNRVAAFEHIDLTRRYTMVDGAASTAFGPAFPRSGCECWNGWSFTG